MTTQQPETDREALQERAQVARNRLFESLDRLDSRAKSWARSAAATTRISGWGLAGAMAFWAGVVLITRHRQQSQRPALVVRPRPQPRFGVTLAIHGARIAAAFVGFLVSRAFASRLLTPEQTTPPASPQLRRLSPNATRAMFADRVSEVEMRGMRNA